MRSGIASRLAATIIVACAVAPAFAQAPLQADADSMHAKLTAISETGNRPRNERPGSVRTVVTDREINAYLTVDGPSFLPRGLMQPQADIGGGGHVTVRGLVDLDAVRTARQRDWLDPLSYMSGLLPFTVTGIVIGANGKGLAVFESATLAGLSVPKNVVKELVRYFTTTPEWPNGVDMDEPIELPADIETILFDPGRATVIQ